MSMLYILTGAGISAESGIPVFRGGSGLWDNYNVEDICTYSTWKDNFELVHEFYDKRRIELGNCKPNAAHKKIAEWQKKYPTQIFTSNVDDLHEQAGSTDVIHLHGTLLSMICDKCGEKFSIGYESWNKIIKSTKCDCDKHNIKPDVVFFGQSAPNYTFLNHILDNLKPTDVFVVIGTSGKVIPIDYYLEGKPGLKFVNNLAPTPGPNGEPLGGGMNGFDPWTKEIYKPATQGVMEIDKLLQNHFGY